MENLKILDCGLMIAELVGYQKRFKSEIRIPNSKI